MHSRMTEQFISRIQKVSMAGNCGGNIDQAYLFEDMKELAERLVKHPEIRCFIVEIADVTIDILKQGAAGNTEYQELYYKYNTVSYALKSR